MASLAFLMRCDRGLSQFSAGGELSRGPVRELTGLHEDLDVAAAQMTSDEFFRERILDVALDRAAERPRTVRAILAGDLDNPIDDFRRERDLQLAIREVLVQLRDQERHDPPQVV